MDYFCDLSEELEEYGFSSFIKEFVSGCQRTMLSRYFAPQQENLTTKCKVKAMSLNYENSKVLNFPTLRNMILKIAPPVHVHNPHKFKQKHGGVVVCKPDTEECNVVYKKRRLMDNFESCT